MHFERIAERFGSVTHCEGRSAHCKVPRYVKFVDAFPMTGTGKIQKFVMREQMIAELGLRVEETA